MGELYSASRYLNRNHECTGLEPYIHFPTEAEIHKEMKTSFAGTVVATSSVEAPAPAPTTAAEAVAQKQKQDSLVADTTTFATSPSGEREFDRYDRRSAIRSLLSKQYEAYGIQEYDRATSEYQPSQISMETEQPQVHIPGGGWTKAFQVNSDFLPLNETREVNNYLHIIKLKRNKNQTLSVYVDDQEFVINLSNVFSKHSQGGPYVKVPNKDLVFSLNNGSTTGVLVLSEIYWENPSADVSNGSRLKKEDWFVERVKGTLYLK
jgi:hypothetical protein